MCFFLLQQVHGKGVESPREIEMRSNAEVVRSLALATDRNMQSWWVTYNNSIDAYNLHKNNTICQNHTLNTMELDDLEDDLGNVSLLPNAHLFKIHNQLTSCP